MEYQIVCEDCKVTVLGSISYPENVQKPEGFVLYQNQCTDCNEAALREQQGE